MTQVVYEGPSGRRNPLRTTLGYRQGEHFLPVGEPVDVPDDVATGLLEGVKGHRFRAHSDQQTLDTDAQAEAGGSDDSAAGTGGTPIPGGDDAAKEPGTPAATTTRGRRG